SNIVLVSSSLDQADALQRLSTQIAAKDQFEDLGDAALTQNSFECLCDQLGMGDQINQPTPVSMEAFDTIKGKVTDGLKRVLKALKEAFIALGKWFREIGTKIKNSSVLLNKRLSSVKEKLRKVDGSKATVEVTI